MKYKKVFLVLPLLFLILVPAVFAASSSDYLSKAQKYINANCSGRNISNQNSLFCFLFYKTGELSVKTDNNTSEINLLKQKVQALEQNQVKSPQSFQFFNGQVNVAGDSSPIFDAQGYSKITLTYQAQTSIYLSVSVDGNSWVTQLQVGEGEAKAGSSITLNTAGRYYSVSTGSTSLPQNQVTANVIGNFSN